jgi:hypothetical protein
MVEVNIDTKSICTQQAEVSEGAAASVRERQFWAVCRACAS